MFAKNSYSWPQRGNRIDHAAGSYECTQFYGTADACSLLFTATQLYGLFQNGSCCVGACFPASNCCECVRLHTVFTPPAFFMRAISHE